MPTRKLQISEVFLTNALLAGEQLCLNRPLASRHILRITSLFPAHCLPLELLPISLRARQESDYEMETLVDDSSRSALHDLR